MKKILGKEMLACIISILGVSTGISTMHFEQTAMDIVNMSELISDETMICEDNNMRGNTNLLKNPSFENDSDNDNIPDYWDVFSPSPSGVIYSWDSTVYHTGAHSVCIESLDGSVAMWQQRVNVSEETVYTFSGCLNLQGVRPPGFCNLQVVFRDDTNNVIEIINLPKHHSTIPWIYDFPHEYTVSTPSNAVKAEVNLYINGRGKVWFDDIFFGPTPTGTISGTVTGKSIPIQGVRVFLWGTDYEAYTDSQGKYTILNVPVASPRYLLIATKNGYMDKPEGDIHVIEDGTTVVDFVLTPGENKPELRVKFASLRETEHLKPFNVSLNAVIDPDLYPPEVQPYLLPSEYIDSDDPVVIQVANQILSTIPPQNRTNLSQVAHAAYLWIIQNIEYDTIYPDHDVTSGRYQTVSGEGWCWGHNFTEWAYKPSEILLQKRGICVEHSRLATAILRALEIPARPVKTYSAQFWVQLPSGDGYWSAMATSSGRSAYRQNGDKWKHFGEMQWDSILAWPIDEGAFIHSDWYTENKCMWRETHPWEVDYEYSSEGYLHALEDLWEFEKTGEAPTNSIPPSHRRYRIHYSDFTLNLTNIGDQETIIARFPLPMNSDYTHFLNITAYWTNHPECVTRTWIEEITNPSVPDTERWFYIEFNLANLTENNLPIVEVREPKDGYLYLFDREIMPTLNNTIIIGRINVEIDAHGVSGIERVGFYIDNELRYTDLEAPYSWLWDERIFGIHEIKVIAYDREGNKAEDKMDVIIFNLW